jgi:hypothetical protein
MLGVIHRVVVFERRFRTRLVYNWRQLWTALFALLQFIVHNEQKLIAQAITVQDMCAVYSKVGCSGIDTIHVYRC